MFGHFSISTYADTVDTPFQADSTYDQELFDSWPATSDQLLQLERIYGGEYRHLLGKLQHIRDWTRFDLCWWVCIFCNCRLELVFLIKGEIIILVSKIRKTKIGWSMIIQYEKTYNTVQLNASHSTTHTGLILSNPLLYV